MCVVDEKAAFVAKGDPMSEYEDCLEEIGQVANLRAQRSTRLFRVLDAACPRMSLGDENRPGKYSSAQSQPRGQIGHADRVGLAGGQRSPIRDDREQAFPMRPRKPAPRHALEECLLPLPHLLGLVEGQRRHKLVGVDRVEATEPREDHHEVFLAHR